jgi:hypothetical protein
MLGLVASACNPSTREVEAGESRIQSQPGQSSKFQASFSYTVRFYFKTKIKTNSNNNKKQSIILTSVLAMI